MNIPELETPRLRLIELTENHLDNLFDIYKDEESMKYWDDFAHKNINETEKTLKLLLERNKKGTGMCWGIILKETPEKVIGTISYNMYEKDGLGMIGYILSRNYWNKGLMTECLKEFIEYGFSSIGIHRIEADVEPGNIVSEKLLKKIGFQKEGLLRERRHYKGKYQSMIIYGLLKTDKRETKH